MSLIEDKLRLLGWPAPWSRPAAPEPEPDPFEPVYDFVPLPGYDNGFAGAGVAAPVRLDPVVFGPDPDLWSTWPGRPPRDY